MASDYDYQAPYYKYGDKPASKPAPMFVKSTSDVDDFGFPKAPIPLDEPLTDETILWHERRKEEVLKSHAGDMEEVEMNMDPLAKRVFTHIPMKGHMSQEQFEEFEYPKAPEYMTEEWMQKQIAIERVDPRENPNLLYDEGQQEFWHTAARKPYAKAILRAEQHWTDRRNVWLKQYEKVENMNQSREEIGEMLEDCSMEAKRLVAPIFHHKITEVTLWNYLREAKEYNLPFRQVLDQPEKQKQLRGLRQKIDEGGDKAAASLMDEYDARIKQCVENNLQKKHEEERGKRVVCDHEMLAKKLNMGEKCKKDGYIEWQKGNTEEALASWRLANDYLKKSKAPEIDKYANKMVCDMHVAILKNIAQAAIKLGYWTEALEAADDAIRLDDQDPKAWFRRACALEGLGRYEEEKAALDRIDDVSVGRVDRDRITKDVETKRGKIQWLYDRDKESQKKSVALALAKGVFGNDREVPAALPPDEDSAAAKQAHAFKAGDVVYVRRAFADFTRGQRGLVIEIDADGDARIQFDGQDDEIDLLMEEDLQNLSLDAPSQEQEEEEEPASLADDPKKRRLLTRDSALELLDALERAYDDTTLQKQIAKLAGDMRGDRDQYSIYMRKVLLEAQGPVLEKWGFPPTHDGAREAQLAVQDHVCMASEDQSVLERADAIARQLHGKMYDVLAAAPRLGRAPPCIVAGEL